MSIIVYYMAGGRVIDETVSLPMVNVEFENKTVLAGFVWGILFWFLLRYWMVARIVWIQGWWEELKVGVPYHLRKRVIPKAYIREKNFKPEDFDSRPEIYINHHPSLGLHYCFEHKTHGIKQTSKLVVRSKEDKLFILLCSAYLFFVRPTLSGYIIPYLMFLVAVSMGVHSYLSQASCS